MKNIELHPAVLIGGGAVAIAAAFYAGDALGGTVALPGLAATRHLDFASLNSLYGLLQRNFDGSTSDTKALDGAKAGLVASAGDPYTVYLNADDAKKLNNDLNGKLSGIGAEIGLKNSLITVIAPISGAPADKAGLKAGDIVASINGEDTSNMSVDTAVTKIRGAKGTQVTLKIVRPNTDPLTITITRDDITVPSVKSSLKNGNVAYINITQFGPDTAEAVTKAATDLKAQGATKVILDLRNDPGGFLDAGVSVASQFLHSGTSVVDERTGGKTTNKLTAEDGGKLIGLPTVVLINSGSASASEIVAAALHDNKAAQLVGQTSFGKGSVQEIKTLPDGAELKVTVAHWYTPAGINIGKAGIKPDYEVAMTTDDYNNSRDPQLDKALDLLK